MNEESVEGDLSILSFMCKSIRRQPCNKISHCFAGERDRNALEGGDLGSESSDSILHDSKDSPDSDKVGAIRSARAVAEGTDSHSVSMTIL